MISKETQDKYLDLLLLYIKKEGMKTFNDGSCGGIYSPQIGDIKFEINENSISIKKMTGKKNSGGYDICENIDTISTYPFTKRRKILKEIWQKYRNNEDKEANDLLKESMKIIKPDHIKSWETKIDG